MEPIEPRHDNPTITKWTTKILFFVLGFIFWTVVFGSCLYGLIKLGG